MSDHSHEILVEAVEGVLQRVVNDPNDWDGDEAAESIYAEFLGWLPDLIKHQDADAIRLRAAEYGDGKTGMIARALLAAADQIEPFYVAPDSARVPSWYRKSDHRLVPYRVINDPTPDEQKERTLR